MKEEYQRREREFMECHDSLCETIVPEHCDCSACPTRELCNWLCENDPNR